MKSTYSQEEKVGLKNKESLFHWNSLPNIKDKMLGKNRAMS